MAMSLQNYYDRVVWVNLAVYILYFTIKYLPAGLYPIVTLIKKKCSNSSNNDNLPLPWVLLLVFGKQLGLNGASKLHKIFLRDTRVISRCGQIIVFYIVILGSVVLALGSALDITLFSVSRICTEDPSIDCYPQLISSVSDTTNMTIDIDSPILDCSFWNSEGISRQVTFVCFQREFFNFELFLAITGALLAFAFIVLNFTIGLLLKITRLCMTKVDSKTMFIIRVIVIVIAVIVEVAMAVLCIVLGVTRVTTDNTNDDPGITFLTMHASEILVIVGIVATLLWLPWEQYVEYQKASHGGVSNPLQNYELQPKSLNGPEKA